MSTRHTPATAATAATDSLLTRTQAAELLQVRPQTMAKWAMDGRGPKITRCGQRLVRYTRSAIEEFLRGGTDADATPSAAIQ